MAKKKKHQGPSGAASGGGMAAAVHDARGETSDWGTKVERPWEPPAAPAPEAEHDKAERKKKASAPSVMGFLQRVGGAAGTGRTPARGLLGKITAEDLKSVGRAPEQPPPAAAPAAEEKPVAQVDVALDPQPVTPPDPLPSVEERLRKVGDMGRRSAVSSGDRANRKDDRYPFSVRVEYSTVGRSAAEMAENLSATGIFIHTSTPLEIGDPVMVNFQVADSAFPLTLPARVKWVSAYGGIDRPSSGMGLEFTALDDKKRRTLAGIIARLRGGRRP
ncbi:MAG: PilZ domain-containing protein [Deltaproteobacteria bacterium]|nr:PilZ domain-containing protein [Deltaproteobacteria bacterium]